MMAGIADNMAQLIVKDLESLVTRHTPERSVSEGYADGLRSLTRLASGAAGLETVPSLDVASGGVLVGLAPGALAGLQVGGFLGRGSYGRVYRGVYQDRDVAIKVCLRSLHREWAGKACHPLVSALSFINVGDKKEIPHNYKPQYFMVPVSSCCLRCVPC